MRTYKYKNLIIEPYWNGYRVYYRHDNGNKELLTYKPTRKEAQTAGKLQVDYMNEKERRK